MTQDKMLQQSDSSASFTSNFSEHTPRKVFVFRHAERVDRTFRSELSHWTDRAFDEDGKYKPFDLNMPKMLPKRHGGPQAFVDDTPLTELGYFHSVLTGKALAMSGIEIHHVYASPALRSIQTANGIVEGLNQPNLKINVEIGLFEWTKFYEYLARWMTVEELIAFKYHINPHYESLHSKHELKMDETIDDWYTRSHHITSKILENSQGNILIVGHRGSPYSCTTQLCGLPIPIEEDSEERVMKIQYLDGIHIEERENGKYKYAKLPIPRFSCSSFTN
uniref:Phosphoglycerate mutase n=1 Tax=Acrobeloides nanus TaxID=290746 RepID=A0A914BUW4_9BILA